MGDLSLSHAKPTSPADATNDAAVAAYIKANNGGNVVLVFAPKAFRLRLDNGGLVRFRQGAQQIDSCFLEHPYVKQQDVRLISNKRKG